MASDPQGSAAPEDRQWCICCSSLIGDPQETGNRCRTCDEWGCEPLNTRVGMRCPEDGSGLA